MFHNGIARYICRYQPFLADRDFICHVLYCHDNCSFDPVGRDYAIDEFADLAANNGEPVYFRLQEDHMGKYRDRLSGLRLRTGSFLFPERAFRCVYHLVFGGPLFGLESNKTVVTALIKE